MPNWVYTSMVVSGERQNLKLFMRRAARPIKWYQRTGPDGEMESSVIHEPLLFYNFVTPEDQKSYWDFDGENKEYWYDWNLNAWGTGRDACDSERDEMEYDKHNDHYSVCYRFSTAWSIPELAMKAMVEQHPTLSFDFHCEEEQGWGATYDGTNGVFTIKRQWDIPKSHADFVALADLYKECPCLHHGSKESIFPDCP